jgi:hypothetical protein
MFVGALALCAVLGLTVPAFGTATRYKILIVASEDGTPPITLKAQVAAQPTVAQVDLFNATDGTPTLAQLEAYDLVVSFEDYSYHDAVAYGNALAAYVDAGGRVIQFAFDNDSGVGGGPQGRWASGGYSAFTIGALANTPGAHLGTFNTLSPLMQGITTLKADNTEGSLTRTIGATQVAAFADARPMIAYKRRVVTVAAYVGDYYGGWSGDYARLIANAAAFARTLHPGDIATVAGNGIAGYSGDGGPAIQAQLEFAPALATMPDGSFLIADFNNNRVRKVSPAGTISTVAGNGTAGYTGDAGPATAAELNQARGVTATPDGGFLLVDRHNNVIRKVSPAGIITTVAGNGTAGYMGDHGPATSAELRLPHQVSLTPDGGFLIADTQNNVIRKVSSTGVITTVAGNGTLGYTGDNGPATSAELGVPEGVTALPDGGFLIADTYNSVIRRVSPAGVITTVAGTGTAGYNGDGITAKTAELNRPEGIAPTADGGYLIADDDNNRVRKVTPTGIISTIAGVGTIGYSGDEAPATAAQFHTPEYVAITADGGLLIADRNNSVIREVVGPVVPQVDPPAVTISPHSPGNKTTIRITGTAPQGSHVALFATADCSGPSLGSLSAADFAATGFTASVARNASTTLRAVVFAAGGQLSQCSRGAITYTEDSIAPKASITKHPRRTIKTRHRRVTVSFSFRSNERGSSFSCQLDHGHFKPCRSGKKYSVKRGRHTFRVRATDRAGNRGKNAQFRFRVVRRH